MRIAVHLDAEIPHGTFQLCMAEQQLHSTKILRSPVDQRGFGSAHGMGAVGCRVQTN